MKLIEINGTAVRIHPTFVFFLPGMEGGLEAPWRGTFYVVATLACVIIHEFGHIFVARHFGIRVPHVTPLPIAGLASIERVPEKPSQEILIALADPALNLAIAIVLSLMLGAHFDLPKWRNSNKSSRRLLAAWRQRFVFRHFPLTRVHPHAQHAAERAEFAGAHGQF